MYICMCVSTYAYGGELTIYLYEYIYVYIHIVAWAYLREWVACECGHMYFVRKPLIHISQSKWRWLDKAELWLKTFQRHFLGWPGDIQSSNIFIFSLWVAQNPEVGNVHPGIYTSVIRDSGKSWPDVWPEESVGVSLSEKATGIGDSLSVCWRLKK